MNRLRTYAALLSAILMSCSHADYGWYLTGGEKFQHLNAACIKAGMTESEVIKLLGEPVSYVWQNGQKHLRYEQTLEGRSTTTWLGFIHVPYRTAPWQMTGDVVVENQSVISVTFANTLPDCPAR